MTASDKAFVLAHYPRAKAVRENVVGRMWGWRIAGVGCAGAGGHGNTEAAAWEVAARAIRLKRGEDA